MSDLTPFPDGVGYLEHAWSGLSDPMRLLLDELERDVQVSGGSGSTYAALQRRELLRGSEPTERGRWLIRWARETGRWS